MSQLAYLAHEALRQEQLERAAHARRVPRGAGSGPTPLALRRIGRRLVLGAAAFRTTSVRRAALGGA
jgi:hypothetical protein